MIVLCVIVFVCESVFFVSAIMSMCVSIFCVCVVVCVRACLCVLCGCGGVGE